MGLRDRARALHAQFVTAEDLAAMNGSIRVDIGLDWTPQLECLVEFAQAAATHALRSGDKELWALVTALRDRLDAIEAQR